MIHYHVGTKMQTYKNRYILYLIYLTYKSSSLHSIHQYKQSHYTIKIRRNIGD